MQVSTILRVLLAAATTISAVSASTSCASVQVLGKSAMIVDGTTTTLNIKLNQQCHTNPPSQVRFSIPGVACTQTSFNINAKAASTFRQKVMCRSDGGASKHLNGAVIDLPVTFTYTGGKVATDQQIIKRKVVATGSCTGMGDPHMVTLDGHKYDFQAPGVFRLFESKNLLVQVFQEKCGPVHKGDQAPSCYQGVSVALGNSVAKFFIQEGKIAVAKGTDSLEWFSVEKLNGDADGYRVFSTADPSTFVDINLSKWTRYNDYPYLNVALQISPYFKSNNVEGLMGNWNGVVADDVKSTLSLTEAHGVPLANNLFTCVGDACTLLTKPSTPTDALAKSIPSEAVLARQAYTVVDSKSIPVLAFTPTLQKYNLRQLQSDPKPSDVNVKARATVSCNKNAKTFEVCEKYVPDANTYKDTVCIADAVILEDLSVIDNAKISYLRTCRRAIDGILESKTLSESEAAKVKSDRAALDFGDVSKCPNDCSQRGKCFAAGCKCDDGYTGKGCVDTI